MALGISQIQKGKGPGNSPFALAMSLVAEYSAIPSLCSKTIMEQRSSRTAIDR
jgi:hypothetical protein